MKRMIKDSFLLKSAILFWRGVIPSLCCSIPAICPILVCMPVSTTIPLPLPPVICVPLKAMLIRSPVERSFSMRASEFFKTGMDSPVSMASVMNSWLVSISLTSAPTMLPASRRIRSPGIKFSAGIFWGLPSLITLTCCADILFKAVMAFSALNSWIKLIRAFNKTMMMMMIASVRSPAMPAIKAAMISVMIMKSVNFNKNRTSGFLFFFSISLFVPYFSNLNPTSSLLSP